MNQGKDIVIAILIAYVAMDLLFGFMFKRKYPSCLEKMGNLLKTQQGMVVVLLGIAAGLLSFYVSRRYR